MPTFQYEAMDNTGLEVKDTIDAASEQEAQSKIREKGFFVTKIAEKGRAKKTKETAKTKGGAKTQADGKKKPPPKKKKGAGGFSIGGVSGKKLCTFTRQLSTLQDAGLPILRSLRILEGQLKPGPLKVKGAMIYPCAVITVATLIVGFIMYYIIPKFKKIFDDFGTELPGITVVLIQCSDSVVNYWYLGPVIPFALWLMIKIIKKNKTGAYIVDWISLKIPLLGLIFRKSIIARTCRTLGTLVASGVPILEALAITRDTAGNAVFYKAYEHIIAAIREGESMAVPLRETRTVDEIVVNMVDVGEETGALDTMLYKVSDVFDEEVGVLVEGLVNLLEPLMVVILGLIVGFIVIALFMPLIKLLNDLS